MENVGGNAFEFAKVKQLEPLKNKVSFVIPTYNGGAIFAAVIKLVMAQKALGSIELVVVDSGSTDGTVELAKRAGAQMVKIPNEEFNHAHARNLGVRKAQGEYVILMTQDAFPTGELWARTLLEPIVLGKAAAVSPMQVPHNNAPLYEKIMLAGLANVTRPGGQDQYTRYAAEDDEETLNNKATLDNVSCGAKRELFLKYPFAAQFAEDRCLGIQLLKAGYTLGMLASVQVKHSHNRPPLYTLRRNVYNAMYLPTVNEETESVGHLCDILVTGYCQIKFLQQEMEQWPKEPMLFAEVMERINKILSEEAIKNLFHPQGRELPPTGDARYDELLKDLEKMRAGKNNSGMVQLFENGLNYFLPWYYKETKGPLFAADVEELRQAMLYEYSRNAGSLLGQYAAGQHNRDAICQLAEKLTKGI